jgi:hypothetical protein
MVSFQRLIQWVQEFLLGGKAAVACSVDHSPPMPVAMLRKSDAVRPLTLFAFMTCTGTAGLLPVHRSDFR